MGKVCEIEGKVAIVHQAWQIPFLWPMEVSICAPTNGPPAFDWSLALLSNEPAFRRQTASQTILPRASLSIWPEDTQLARATSSSCPSSGPYNPALLALEEGKGLVANRPVWFPEVPRKEVPQKWPFLSATWSGGGRWQTLV